MRTNRTYRIDESIPARVQEQAERHDISLSDTVNFLLLFALAEVENGRTTIPTRPGKAVVDWQKVN
ncbi:MAG: hypothetical protein KJ063_23855 [Anaerolineae bacterium]|nr:hypothetical protein [Anaerolineae bacterium]